MCLSLRSYGLPYMLYVYGSAWHLLLYYCMEYYLLLFFLSCACYSATATFAMSTFPRDISASPFFLFAFLMRYKSGSGANYSHELFNPVWTFCKGKIDRYLYIWETIDVVSQCIQQRSTCICHSLDKVIPYNNRCRAEQCIIHIACLADHMIRKTDMGGGDHKRHITNVARTSVNWKVRRKVRRSLRLYGGLYGRSRPGKSAGAICRHIQNPLVIAHHAGSQTKKCSAE